VFEQEIGAIMKQLRLFVWGLPLLLVRILAAQMPAGFSWVNLESDKTTMAAVRGKLHDPTITSIREVGVKGDFALVMTASREGETIPDGDRWTIYNVPLRTGDARTLASGYEVKVQDWIGSELAITYEDCFGCEPEMLFTTFHFRDNIGWLARWPDKTQDTKYPQPGAVVAATGVGDPYDDDVVSQVFAVVMLPGNSFAAGNWTHTRNTQSGKIDDTVVRYSIDPKTQEDSVDRLAGQAALNWKRQICTPSNVVAIPSVGQDSKVCRDVLRAAKSKRGSSQ
jgi:hypothetical protein